MRSMEYYGDDDYVRTSPGLVPFQPDLGSGSSLPFASLWLSQDISDIPSVSVRIVRGKLF